MVQVKKEVMMRELEFVGSGTRGVRRTMHCEVHLFFFVRIRRDMKYELSQG